MFILAGKHHLEAEAEMCWLLALCDYNSDHFSWQLHLASKCRAIRSISSTDQVSFAVSVRPPLGTVNWRDLTDHSVKISSDLLGCGFQFHCGMSSRWEDLVSLNLRFGKTQQTQIEIWAEGQGRVEAAADVFPNEEVDFQIHTWADFRGVAVNVPLNAGDPDAYAESRIRALLPRYAFTAPQLRRTSDSDRVIRAVEVLFGPG
jgi:hypothetical protein